MIIGGEELFSQRVHHCPIALRLVTLDDDDVIFFRVELFSVLAVKLPVRAVAADQIVAAGFEF